MNSSMEPSIKKQKIQNKRAKFVYNLALYSLTSIITCFFFSSPFWFPSITNHFFSSFPNVISFCLNPKCFFVVGNLIVLILVGETKLKQSSSSPTSDIYDEYVARSRSNLHHSVEEKKKEMIENSTPHGEEIIKKKGILRSSKSAVWGESGMVKTEKVTKGKKEEKSLDGEKIKVGMSSSKSAVWGESGMVKTEKVTKGKKEEKSLDGEKIKVGMRSSKSAVWGESGMVKTENITKGKKEEKKFHGGEKIKTGMRSSKSAVWGESGMVKTEKITKGKKEEKSAVWSEGEKVKGKKEEQLNKMNMNDEEKKMGMRSCKSAVWSESEIVERENKGKGKKEEQLCNNGGMDDHQENKMGMRSCKSEIWSESEIVRLGKTMAKEEDVQLNMLNKRVEDFIARVNKQRLLEEDGRG